MTTNEKLRILQQHGIKTTHLDGVAYASNVFGNGREFTTTWVEVASMNVGRSGQHERIRMA